MKLEERTTQNFLGIRLQPHFSLGMLLTTLLSVRSIYLTGLGIGVFQCLQPVQWAMAIDLLPDPVDQARFFPIMAAITNGSVASIVGEGLAYLCLGLYLDDYTPVWAVLSLLTVAVCLFLWFILPETLPYPKKWSGWREFSRDLIHTTSAPGLESLDEPQSGAGCFRGARLWCQGTGGADSGTNRA